MPPMPVDINAYICFKPFFHHINNSCTSCFPPLLLSTLKLLSSPTPSALFKVQAMQPGEITGVRYQTPADQQYIGHFNTMQNHISTLHINGFSRPITQYQMSSAVHELIPQPSFSNTSTSDEAEEQQLGIIDERKQRRMISNRESARRSRMRKQKQLDELWSQVIRLQSENRQLIEKLNHASNSHNQVAQENTRLKEEASELRQMLSNLQLDNSYNNLRDLDEVPCNTVHLVAESINQSITNSLH